MARALGSARPHRLPSESVNRWANECASSVCGMVKAREMALCAGGAAMAAFVSRSLPPRPTSQAERQQQQLAVQSHRQAQGPSQRAAMCSALSARGLLAAQAPPPAPRRVEGGRRAGCSGRSARLRLVAGGLGWGGAAAAEGGRGERRGRRTPLPTLPSTAAAAASPQLAVHIGDTTLAFPLPAEEGRRLSGALGSCFQTFADKKAAERPKRWPAMEYTLTGGWARGSRVGRGGPGRGSVVRAAGARPLLVRQASEGGCKCVRACVRAHARRGGSRTAAPLRCRRRGGGGSGAV